MMLSLIFLHEQKIKFKNNGRSKKKYNAIILYTIVDTVSCKFLANQSDEKKIPCFSVLGNLIMNFSKLLNQKASHVPSGQHALMKNIMKELKPFNLPWHMMMEI